MSGSSAQPEDAALIGQFTADLSSPGRHVVALERLAARVVSGLAELPGSAAATQAVLSAAAAAYPPSDTRSEASALALSQSLMIEGMALAFAAAAAMPGPPEPATMNELTLLLQKIDGPAQGGELARARRDFAAVAARALASPDAISTLAYQLEPGTSLELRGWAAGLGLLISARHDLIGG